MRNRRLGIGIISGLLLVNWFAAAVHAAPSYSIIALDILPVASGEAPFGYRSFAYALNSQGVVVGESTLDTSGNIGQTRPVMWNNSNEAEELWADQNFGGKALGINDAGFVIGRYGSGSGIPQPGSGIPDGGGFIWDPTTRSFADLGDLGGQRVEATGINDLGQVVGSSENFESDPRAFIWNATGGMLDLGTLGGNTSRGTAINAIGQVIGYSTLANGSQHPFIWDATNGMRDLGTLDSQGDVQSFAFAVNDGAEVVGVEFGSGGFIWDAALGIRSIGNIVPSDINNFGQVVGGIGMDALFWEQDAGLRNLQDLIPSGSGWDLSGANAINDAGQIVGVGFFNDQIRGFLMTPIPEPHTGLLCMAGVALMPVARRMRRTRPSYM